MSKTTKLILLSSAILGALVAYPIVRDIYEKDLTAAGLEELDRWKHEITRCVVRSGDLESCSVGGKNGVPYDLITGSDYLENAKTRFENGSITIRAQLRSRGYENVTPDVTISLHDVDTPSLWALTSNVCNGPRDLIRCK